LTRLPVISSPGIDGSFSAAEKIHSLSSSDGSAVAPDAKTQIRIVISALNIRPPPTRISVVWWSVEQHAE
jgi:hypothetical protein